MTQPKQTVVSFRVDQHLAEILNNLPDKSAFIRDAILQRFHAVCPFCQGRGVLPQIIAEWLTARLADVESVECTCCHYAYPTELVRHELKSAGKERFVCPHCGEHDHGH
jgi:transposase-like protein